MELRKGMPVVSKAGHDKDECYIVLYIEGICAYLVNGKNRTMDFPKKKKLKHLQPMNEVPEILQEKLQKNEAWTDEEIKRAIKLLKSGLI